VLRFLPLLLVATACAAPEPAFPAGAAADYQLGGAYPPPAGVTLVVRDRTADPAPDVYNVCYVNGFQSQPADRADWLTGRPELVLHTDGEPLVDENWPDELILDTSTAANRTRLTEIVGSAIDDCAGFDAVELDNLDSYLRSAGALTLEDNLALATALVAHAHEAGLAVGQKNTAELGTRGRDEAGFDFAVTEECVRWSECAAYEAVYEDRVVNIEYTDDWSDPSQVCAAEDRPAATIVRDRDLVPRNDSGWFYLRCD